MNKLKIAILLIGIDEDINISKQWYLKNEIMENRILFPREKIRLSIFFNLMAKTNKIGFFFLTEIS